MKAVTVYSIINEIQMVANNYAQYQMFIIKYDLDMPIEFYEHVIFESCNEPFKVWTTINAFVYKYRNLEGIPMMEETTRIVKEVYNNPCSRETFVLNTNF